MLFAKLLHRIAHYLIRLKGAHALIDYATVGVQQRYTSVVIIPTSRDRHRTRNNHFMIYLL